MSTGAARDRKRSAKNPVPHSRHFRSYPILADVKTVQSRLRHADIGTTLDIYTHAINRDKLVAQNQVMEAMRKPGLVN